jgi:CRISPR-associated protein Cas1
MASLYLTEQGSVLRRDGGRLTVEKDGTTLLAVPRVQVDRLVVMGNVQVSTQALTLLLDEGIETTFLTSHGRLKGRLVPAYGRDVALRLTQYDKARDTAFGLSVARAIVEAKIVNSRALLARHARNHPEAELDEAVATLARRVDEARRKQTVASLRGAEGVAAAVYFGAWPRLWRNPEVVFTGRQRRPPRDPLNALLGFGYTLAGNELYAAVTSVGLDPHLGFLHGISYGRPSLSLDLLEEFRAPLVDRLTLRLINLKIITAADFEPPAAGEGEEPAGLRLTAAARKRYLVEWERCVAVTFKHPLTGQETTFRRAFALQAQAMARAIRQGVEYKPLRQP